MSKLEELINELCPNGVKYTSLEKVAKISNGKDHKHLENGEIPVYGSGGIMRYANQYIYNKVSVLIPRKGSIGNIFYVDTPFWIVDTIFYTQINFDLLNARFLYHFLLTQNIERLNTAGGVPSLTKAVLDKIQIPLPPLPVQEEIVRILDSFTELTTELTAELTSELTARKKQYEYYASKLFLETHAEHFPMSKLAKFSYGYTDSAKDSGDTRFIRITDINSQGYLKGTDIKYIMMNDDAKNSLLSKGDLVMARTGASYGKTLYFTGEEQSVYASFLIKISPDNSKILNKYYWHFTKTSLYWQQASNLVTTGGQPQFNSPALKQIVIPVPSLYEQQRIVDILDRFDTLCNDISQGLPAEIKARQQQYEYYRDKLLTFKKKEA